MKKYCFFLAAAVLCVSLCGCVKDPASAGSQTSRPTQAQGQPSQPSATEITGDHSLLQPSQPLQDRTPLVLKETGAVRIPYTVNVSSVRYIASAAQLPDHEAFEKYDDAWFETGALILVMESVNSSSAQVQIGSVAVSDGIATVTMDRQPKGDAGNPAMATWLAWAEVEPGLQLRWVIGNPAMDSDVSYS